MDLGDMKNQKVEHKKKADAAYSAFIDCFSRQIWAKPLKQKTQQEVMAKVSQFVRDVRPRPKIISSDNGQEFRGLVSEFLASKVSHRGTSPSAT